MDTIWIGVKNVKTKIWHACFEQKILFNVSDFFSGLVFFWCFSQLSCHMLKSMVKLYKNDLKGNRNLLWVSGRFQLLRVQVTKGKITVHVWRKFGRNQLNFWFELAWGSSLRGFVLCHNLLKESVLSNATKKMLVL